MHAEHCVTLAELKYDSVEDAQIVSAAFEYYAYEIIKLDDGDMNDATFIFQLARQIYSQRPIVGFPIHAESD